MSVFTMLAQEGYGTLHLHRDEATGLEALVALYSTKLGPAIGGCRCLPYDREEDAVRDVLRLAKGMAYKAAISGLPHGGGKAVIRYPRGEVDREALFAAFGRFVDTLGGDYITCEDSGTSTADMDVVARHTQHVLGTSAGSGDPSPWTARGVRRGIEAALRFQLGREDLDGVHVAIQGVGHVGFHLVQELAARGARLTLCDIQPRNLERVQQVAQVSVVPVEEILSVRCDVFAPCALGGVLNEGSIATLDTKIVAGAANNVLATPQDGIRLFQRGILYAPDYAINAGGLMQVAHSFDGGARFNEPVEDLVDSIYDNLWTIFTRSKAEDCPPAIMADRIAEERMA